MTNATSEPILFALLNGGDPVWIAANATWRITGGFDVYPSYDPIERNTAISINELASGYSIRTGYYAITTPSPIPLRIEKNTNGTWKITSSVSAISIVSP